MTTIRLTQTQVDDLISLDDNSAVDWFRPVARRVIGELCDLIEDANRPKDPDDERLVEN